MVERISAINGDRIQWCLADQNISVDELADETSVSSESIELAIAGARGLTFAQLSKVGAFFGRNALFFLETGPVETNQVYSPAFRTITNSKPELSIRLKRLVQRAEQHRLVYLALREDLGDPVPAFEPPRIYTNNAKGTAESARQWLGLAPGKKFADFRTAIEARGILVIRSNGYGGAWQIPKNSPIAGFSLYETTCPVIVVKKETAEAREIFTLMHELGHLLLHKKSSVDDMNDMVSETGSEARVNEFAGLVLVPDEVLEDVDLEMQPQDFAEYADWLTSITRSTGASVEVVVRRLANEGRISIQEYLNYRDWRNSQNVDQNDSDGRRLYRHREPLKIFGDRYVGAVLSALSEKRISLLRASKYLDGLKLDDVQLLKQYYANR